MRFGVICLLTLTLFACAAHHEGISLYERGRHHEAAVSWARCAQTGSDVCMLFLGFMYRDGIVQDPARMQKAALLFSESARRGNPFAREQLIEMGKPVPRVDLPGYHTSPSVTDALLSTPGLGEALGGALRRAR